MSEGEGHLRQHCRDAEHHYIKKKKNKKEQTSVLRKTRVRLAQKKKKSSLNFPLEWSRQADPTIKYKNIFDSQISFDIQAEGKEEVHAIEEAASSPQTIQ